MSAEEDPIDMDLSGEPEAAATSALATSALGPLAARQESIAQMLVEDTNLEKLTHFRGWTDPPLYAKMKYLVAFASAVGKQDKEGFKFPDLSTELLRTDWQLRNSVKQQTRKILESITKIFERGGESGRRGGILGRR